MKSLKVFGEHDEATIEQMNRALNDPRAVRGVLCADGHLGYSVPIGGVVAYREAISPSAVGYDIACGNMAVRLDLNEEDIMPYLPELLDEIQGTISFGVGRVNNERVDSKIFDLPFWDFPLFRDLKELAINQLGTVGSGNHFVDIFSDWNKNIWVGVHFGSRGLGHKLATFFVKAAGGKDGMDVAPAVVSVNSPLGDDYLFAMMVAGAYAYEGREWVTKKVAGILGGNIADTVHNHHNYAWKEEHDGEVLWVIRKGSTPANPGQRSFIGGSMGDNSVIVHGISSKHSEEALRSTVHGSGRVMSRSKAAGKVRYKRGKRVRISEGEISREMMMDWLDNRGILLRGAGTDESPHCYRRLEDVLTEHEGTIEVETVLRPLGVVMAGADEVDPYKD